MGTARREVERLVSWKKGGVSGARQIVIRTLARTQNKKVKECSLKKDLSEWSPQTPSTGPLPWQAHRSWSHTSTWAPGLSGLMLCSQLWKGGRAEAVTKPCPKGSVHSRRETQGKSGEPAPHSYDSYNNGLESIGGLWNYFSKIQ